jgi:polyhydroxyalkanoate synthesis regulator phasin
MYPADFPPPQSYSQEEVQEILYLAIARQVDKGEITREQLLEIADELAIESQDLEAAEKEWKASKIINIKRYEFDLYRREELKNKTTRYLIINGFIFTINLISAGTISWAIYIALLMGLPLSLSAWKTLQKTGQIYERDFQRWKIKQEMKESFSSIWTQIKKIFQF